jgi:5'(3')-deoxyribonucleotidase
VVGVDLDGVLGDQVVDVLPRIQRRLGIDLAWEEVTEFRLPLGKSDLAQEILLAQQDQEYLLNMPVHHGAVELIKSLRQHYNVVLITARPDVSRSLTEHWLSEHGLSFDRVISATEAHKSLHGTDVLIDDYTSNIEEFLERTNGLGILVDRPWNRRDRVNLSPWCDTDRLEIVESLEAIPSIVAAFDAAQTIRSPGG